MLRRRKGSELKPPPKSPPHRDGDDDEKRREKEADRREKRPKNWTCVDSCCWFVGCICSIWWFLLFLYNAMPASFPQYVTEAITGPLPDPPGVKLQKEGLTANHPVVFVPGIVTGGLELWEGHQCAEGLFRKRLWGGTFGEVYKRGQSGLLFGAHKVMLRKSLWGDAFVVVYKRPLCWVEHMSLDNETGLDPSGVRIRPVSGLVAADYFAPGYFVWAVLIANLARIGYEEKNMYMAAYDWRISFQNTEVRDQTLSRIKSNIELMVATSGGRKVVVIPHSMGVLYFLHFMKWVEAPSPMGGGGGSDWCAQHIKAVMNIGGPFLGVPKAVSGLFSAEAKDIAVARAIAPGVLDMDVFGFQTLQHVMRMTRTWDSTMSMIPKGGDTIWGGLDWSPEEGYECIAKKMKNNDTLTVEQNGNGSLGNTKHVHYGRIISFGKDVADAKSSEIERMDFRGAVRGNNLVNTTNCDMMKRGSAHFSLPNAPNMEIFSMYGVGIPTERAYVYKLSSASECYIPFQIDTSANGENDCNCLKGGVFNVDGDETVPILSAGFMAAKGWRGKTRFNPSGIGTHIREYNHAPPATLLEGRGTQSGAHVDIMGNFALIEDIIRVAAGATGEDLGGDRVYSDIFKWSERINLQL
ncbi:phospholipid:diacylglycerol acyltransferase [Actinidia rufa]|uniref:phospholipid:diacylglycerol acyltransferase n=1 Tax=Actinidia rufa TaxID=165716 RepID=A0A7J0DVY1_9ERIC|nr:phospholipid:diacylglycerol acyltransferase [Actinidia rufa]